MSDLRLSAARSRANAGRPARGRLVRRVRRALRTIGRAAARSGVRGRLIVALLQGVLVPAAVLADAREPARAEQPSPDPRKAPAPAHPADCVFCGFVAATGEPSPAPRPAPMPRPGRGPAPARVAPRRVAAAPRSPLPRAPPSLRTPPGPVPAE